MVRVSAPQRTCRLADCCRNRQHRSQPPISRFRRWVVLTAHRRNGRSDHWHDCGGGTYSRPRQSAIRGCVFMGADRDPFCKRTATRLDRGEHDYCRNIGYWRLPYTSSSYSRIEEPHLLNNKVGRRQTRPFKLSRIEARDKISPRLSTPFSPSLPVCDQDRSF